MILKYRKIIISVFIVLALLSGYFTTKLNFGFSFDQFFPQGDPDLEFYKKFIEDFETDDNFLLVAIENESTVFDSTFLNKFHQLALDMRELPFVTQVQSLTQLSYPVKTPFGLSALPYLHIDQPEYYEADKKSILSDPRFVYNLIDGKGKSLAIALKTEENLSMANARILADDLDNLLDKVAFKNQTHILGRAFFTRELIDFQKREMLLAFIASILLVTLIMVIIYRKPIGIIISLGSIALGLLLFTGYLGAAGIELNAVSALFPVIMLIVGSSDVIHIFSKYTDELARGKSRNIAMNITIKEIGLATLMTSVTTAIGFASLSMSKLRTIQEFGWNAGIGVMVAYVTVLLFTTSVLSLFERDQIIRSHPENSKWGLLMDSIFNIVQNHSKKVLLVSAILIGVFFIGMKFISTNYSLEDNLPRGSRVAQDFKFFEQNYAGFRPLEIAIFAKNGKSVNDYEVMKEVDRLEDKLRSYDFVNSSMSMATLYRSMHKMNNNNSDAAYIFPETKAEYREYRKMIARLSRDGGDMLVSKDKTKTRISSRIKDIGADNIKLMGVEFDQWFLDNIDTSLIDMRRTGTGLILDKNSEYVSDSILKGLGMSVLVISVLMGFLFRSFLMTGIALIANVIPLLMAAAILGYFGIELEAGVSIMFAIIFGIAVDDSIHFLGRYKLCKLDGMDNISAVRMSTQETGKAIIITSIVLFFGFFNMVFSVNPPTFTIGLLIAVTLVGAVICDIILLPVLILKLMREDQ